MTIFFKNSTLFYILNKNLEKKKIISKINLSLQKIYYDNVLKDRIYVASSSIKASVFFRRKFVNNLIFNHNQESFVSYFSSLEKKFFRFHLYPRLHFKKLHIKTITFRKKIIKFYEKTQTLNQLTAHYNISHKKIRNIIESTHYNTFQNFFHIKKIYRVKHYFLTNKGTIVSTKHDGIHRKIITGLINVLPLEKQFKFFRILKSIYLILKFIKISSLKSPFIKKNIFTFFTNYLYIQYFRFSLKKFKFYWKDNNLRIRRRNHFFRLFFLIIYPRVNRYLTIYKRYIFKKLSNSIKTIKSNYNKNYNNFILSEYSFPFGRLRHLNKIEKVQKLQILNNALILYNWLLIYGFSKNLNTINGLIDNIWPYIIIKVRLLVNFIKQINYTQLFINGLTLFNITAHIITAKLYVLKNGWNHRRIFRTLKNKQTILPRLHFIRYWIFKASFIYFRRYSLVHYWKFLRKRFFKRYSKSLRLIKYRKKPPRITRSRLRLFIRKLSLKIQRDVLVLRKYKHLNISSKVYKRLIRTIMKRVFKRRKLRRKIRGYRKKLWFGWRWRTRTRLQLLIALYDYLSRTYRKVKPHYIVSNKLKITNFQPFRTLILNTKIPSLWKNNTLIKKKPEQILIDLDTKFFNIFFYSNSLSAKKFWIFLKNVIKLPVKKRLNKKLLRDKIINKIGFKDKLKIKILNKFNIKNKLEIIATNKLNFKNNFKIIYVNEFGNNKFFVNKLKNQLKAISTYKSNFLSKKKNLTSLNSSYLLKCINHKKGTLGIYIILKTNKFPITSILQFVQNRQINKSLIVFRQKRIYIIKNSKESNVKRINEYSLISVPKYIKGDIMPLNVKKTIIDSTYKKQNKKSNLEKQDNRLKEISITTNSWKKKIQIIIEGIKKKNLIETNIQYIQTKNLIRKNISRRGKNVNQQNFWKKRKNKWHKPENTWNLKQANVWSISKNINQWKNGGNKYKNLNQKNKWNKPYNQSKKGNWNKNKNQIELNNLNQKNNQNQIIKPKKKWNKKWNKNHQFTKLKIDFNTINSKDYNF